MFEENQASYLSSSFMVNELFLLAIVNFYQNAEHTCLVIVKLNSLIKENNNHHHVL